MSSVFCACLERNQSERERRMREKGTEKRGREREEAEEKKRGVGRRVATNGVVRRLAIR